MPFFLPHNSSEPGASAAVQALHKLAEYKNTGGFSKELKEVRLWGSACEALAPHAEAPGKIFEPAHAIASLRAFTTSLARVRKGSDKAPLLLRDEPEAE